MIVSCPDCPWEQERNTRTLADTALAAHRHLRHGEPLPAHQPVKQLDGVRFQEAFITAVRALPVGTEFTTADMHGQIPDPPHHNHWGSAQAAAAHLGLIRPVDAQRSTLPTTKGSRLLRWVRVPEVVRTS